MRGDDTGPMHRTLAMRDGPSPAALADQTQAPESVARLFREHGRFVMRAVLRLGVAERDAQDVCQEVFLTALRRHADFGTGRETTWLYGICLRVAANHRRKAHRRYEETQAEVVAPTDTPATEQEIDARRLMRRLDAALERLPRKKREVFVLFEFAEREMEEVAAILGIPLKTCYSRLYAARAELQADLATPGGRP